MTDGLNDTTNMVSALKIVGPKFTAGEARRGCGVVLWTWLRDLEDVWVGSSVVL